MAGVIGSIPGVTWVWRKTHHTTAAITVDDMQVITAITLVHMYTNSLTGRLQWWVNHEGKGGEEDEERGIDEEITRVDDIAVVSPLVVEQFDHNGVPEEIYLIVFHL